MKQQTVANILKVVLIIATAAFIISMSSCRCIKETECAYVKRSYVGYK